jgi:hypothetical protein
MKNLRNRLLIGLASSFVIGQASAASDRQLLVGQWTCEASFVDLYEVHLTSHHHFSKDGSLTSDGDVVLAMPKSTISVGYHLTATGQWSINGKSLTLKGKVTSVENTMHPEWDKMLNLQQLIPESLHGTATIKHLDATSLVVNDHHTGKDYTCVKG